MLLIVRNQTYEKLYFFSPDGDKQWTGTCLPASSSKRVTLAARRLQISRVSEPEKASMAVAVVSIPRSLCAWKPLPGLDSSPWLAYYRRSAGKRCYLVVMPRRDPSCFLKSIPDTVPLSSLMLPGTHETMALYGWPISQCQSVTLGAQLNSGIRVIDIRLAINGNRLISFHGIVSQYTAFSDVLHQLHAFLTAPSTCSETVVVSIKQEDDDTRRFPQLVREEIMKSPGGLDMWYLEDRIPNLGEVRGKAVMFSRFGGDGWTGGAVGIHPPVWPDSARLGFTWDCKGTIIRVQDWYNHLSFLSIPEKVEASTEILVAPEDFPSLLSISFLSASSLPFALPPLVALGLGWPNLKLGFEGVNSRVGRWLVERLTGTTPGLERNNDAGPRIRGWALMDFSHDPASLIPLFIECNFRGRKAGEEGWI
ncbi:PLC-like phosphodiesterase [Pisolithus thermaeus]|nr:PLC-like phosphodiesterase [Pisolithus thermaeus]